MRCQQKCILKHWQTPVRLLLVFVCLFCLKLCVMILLLLLAQAGEWLLWRGEQAAAGGRVGARLTTETKGGSSLVLLKGR